MSTRSASLDRLQAGFVPADPGLISSVRRNAIVAWGNQPRLIAAVPGRIEIVGIHVDYNGGDVLAAAIDRWVEIAGRRGVGILLGQAADMRRRFVSVYGWRSNH